MWRIQSQITASAKVIYDKAYDNLSYLMSWENNISEEGLENIDEKILNDKLMDYNNCIEIDKYEDEDNSTRILPPVSVVEAYSVFFGPPTHIIDNIYLGSAYNAALYETLNELNIKVIVNVTREISNYYPGEFTYIKFDIYDNNMHSIAGHLEKAFDNILYHQRNTEGNILIHCYMGASRSASVLIYYLMKTQKNNNGEYLTFDEALNFIKSKRTIVNPTFRFTKDLAKSMMDS